MKRDNSSKKHMWHINITYFDAHLDKNTKDERLNLPIEARMKIPKPILYGEFVTAQLDENLTRIVKIGANLHHSVEKDLINFFRGNINLCTVSLEEMPNIDPIGACHQLNIDPSVQYVAQRRRHKFPENIKATRNTVRRILLAKFIFVLKYTDWLSNVFPVKKSSGRCRMCVDYIDANKKHLKVHIRCTSLISW